MANRDREEITMDDYIEQRYYGNVFKEEPAKKGAAGEQFKKMVDGFIKYLRDSKQRGMGQVKQVV